MTPHDEERLMQYLDGELDVAGRREVEQLLSASVEARALLGNLVDTGDLVRELAHGRGEAAGIADAVFDRIDAEGVSPPLRVLPGGVLGAGRGRGAAGRRADTPARGLRPWAEGAALLAVAAAVALLVHQRGSARAPVIAPVVQSGAELASAGPAAAAAAAAEPESGAAIESVDFGAQNGSIFLVATGPQVTPVVWLLDEPESGEDGPKPL